MARFTSVSTKQFHPIIAAVFATCAVLLFKSWLLLFPKHSDGLKAFDVRSNLIDQTSEFPPNTTLSRRDDFSCGPGHPCSNGACCGASGYCGYGATYCGMGCVSNCNAVAECGQYAQPAGKTCLLNVCCSQFGFCGTTQEFCTDGCQSNCDLHPSPPAGGKIGDVRQKVIGYYEAWSARRSCHSMDPTGLPIDGLTHVNFAFAYITPDNYEITTMDAATSADLFQTTADVKTFKTGNQDLKVFVSVGGWTFSDNGTATQPLYGEIAADEGKRLTFARNVVKFLDQYGFDGLDIDWEYPGAPDRGGRPDDTKNYVLLLQTLKMVFDSSPRSLGLSFTVPSSYWYLRWFDLPNMIKHADWINLMSYDLHGFWDRDNPIGSIVQGHTNLTEIKLAVELLWRVQVPPAKVVMGVGFYGRSFQLSDPSCQTPGCPFGGGANPGACTDTSGILGYFEIMDILDGATTPAASGGSSRKRGTSSIRPVHDEQDAVNYFTFNGNQWVSYDDGVTFQQKVKWANGIGLGGLMIWASDLDDKSFTAMSGLLDRPVGGLNINSNAKAVSQDWSGQNGQQCSRFTECVDLDNPQASSCGAGFVQVGWDDAGCGHAGKHYGKPICCPVAAYPRNCTWYGQPSDCNGQCVAGQITLFRSSYGGAPADPNGGNTNKCTRGDKVFCCNADHWADLIDACQFGPCGGGCSSGFSPVTYKNDYQICQYYFGHSGPTNRDFCCPDPVKLKNCHWVGKGDCADDSCSGTDVEIMTDAYGDSTNSCNWGRTKVCCCNAPSDEPDFLPVSLKDIFPTLPPPADNVKFDLQFPKGGSGSNPDKSAFGFVLIDGPPSAVTSAKRKRDGTASDLRFIDCEAIKEPKGQRINFVCTYNGPGSDCDDMMQDGIAGTIIEMPEHCGLGTYAVARHVADAEDQSISPDLAGIKNTTVKVLTFDYNFSSVRRDSGDIYFRADYSNIPGYWKNVVDSPASKKRSLDRRFWSSDSSAWGKKFSLVDDERALGSRFQTDIGKTLFSGVKACGSSNAYAEILSKGSVSGNARLGISMVGTISPSFNIEEVNSYLDTQVDANLNLEFSLFGDFNLPFTTASLLQDPITIDEFNHIGIVSIAPTLEVDISLSAQIEVAANFSTGVHAFTSTSILQSFPGAVLSSRGQTDQQTVPNSMSGDIYDGSQGQIKVDLQPKMGLTIKLNKYGTDGVNLNAFVQGGFDTYNALTLGSDKSFKVSMGTSAASGELTYSNSIEEFPQWSKDNDMSRKIGNDNPARILLSGTTGQASNGDGPPPPHNIQNDDTAIFSNVRSQFLGCPNRLSARTNITCNLDLCRLDSNYCNDDDSAAQSSFSALGKRAPARTFPVALNNGATIQVASRPYPSRGELFNGRNGGQVLEGAFDYILDDDECDSTDVIDHAIDTIDLNRFVTEHILELQTIPQFIRAANTGTLPSGGRARTAPIPAAFWQNTWNSPVLGNNLPAVGQGASPNVPNDRVFEALGSNANRADFVLTREDINAAKAHFWSLESPVATNVFQGLVRNAITNGRDENRFLQYLRNARAVFHYLQDHDVSQRLQHEATTVRSQLQIIEQNVAGAAGLTAMWDEFISDFYRSIGSFARTWMTDRINEIRTLYNSASPAPANRQRVLDVITSLENEIPGAHVP